MATPFVVLTEGQTARLAGAEVGSLTLEAGAVSYSDQDTDGAVLKIHKRTNVSEVGDVRLVGLGVTSRVTVHLEPRSRKKKGD